VHISAGKDHKTVVDFVEVLESKQGDRNAIKQVSCDMSPAFIKGVKENMPEAEITFDKFHIIKLINEAVDQVRREEGSYTPLPIVLKCCALYPLAFLFAACKTEFKPSRIPLLI
jgi:hypothetical protein